MPMLDTTGGGGAETERPPPDDDNDIDDNNNYMTMMMHVNDHNSATTSNRQNCHAYVALVRAFENVNVQGMEASQQYQTIFEQDGNMGLVRCLQNEYWLRRLIFDTCRVYSSLPLSDLCATLQTLPEPTTILLQQLATERSWKIRIDENNNNMVHFPRLPRPTEDAAVQQAELTVLATMMEKLHVLIATTPKYLSIARRGGGGDFGGAEASAGPRGVEEL
jgi:hypothetical protein